MTYILTLLRNLWASLMSYLQAGKRELKPGENQLEKQVTECEQAKQLWSNGAVRWELSSFFNSKL